MTNEVSLNSMFFTIKNNSKILISERIVDRIENKENT